MKAVFCDELNGSWPDWQKFRKYGLTRVYVDAREATRTLIDGIKSQHFEAGIYRDPSWTGSSAIDLAKLAHADLIRVLPPGLPADPCAVLFDVESPHDPQYIVDLLTQWRKVRPTRETAWTCEPHQGGWFSKELVDRINADGLFTVIPQTYGGSMEPFAPEAMLEDITSRGVKRERVKLFYDAIRGAPAYMDGVVFTDQRLPS